MNFDMPLFFVDVETGGEIDGKHQIIEVAYSLLRDGGPCDIVSSLIKNVFPVDHASSVVHQLRDEDLTGAPAADDVLPDVFRAGRDCVWVCYHSCFDLSVLGDNIGTLPDFAENIVALDAHRVCVAAWPDMPCHKMHYLYHALGIPRTSSVHRAADDVSIMISVFKAACHKIFGGGDVSVAKLIDISNAPMPITHIKFGKYSGQSLSEIPTDYFDWWLNKRPQSNDENHDLNYAVALEVSRRGHGGVDVNHYASLAIAHAARWCTPYASSFQKS